ncbi:Golgi apparatus membrane protein-like protein ECHIDNA [Spinacia oleracea]|uniref:Golgi apparatus membrane protein TVP23 n=1 Tax=Spinacia oleracea TaxID=3562 RepID=A0ABM3RHH1_SPIOL|nr:Golgi apparatus membrane protein-like protein ECHIDNA [Spinacia oleracea]
MRVIQIPHSLLDFLRASSFYTEVPVVLLMSDILKGDVNCSALLRFSEVVTLFHEFGYVSLARMNKKDSWLFWWSLYLTAALWIILGVFSLIRFQADYLLVVAVCLSLSIANIVGFTKCRKGYILFGGSCLAVVGAFQFLA